MKKILIGVLSFTLIAAFAGCKSDTDNTDVSYSGNDEFYPFSQSTSTGEVTSIAYAPDISDTESTTESSAAENTMTTTSQSKTETTTTQADIITTESTTETLRNDIEETEDMPEDRDTNNAATPNGSTIYNDTKRYEKYIIVNVTPQKIYWNEIKDYNIAIGQPIDIPIPVIFDDFLTGADEVMIYMTSSGKLMGDISLDNGNILKGMTYPQYWSRDYLCPIVNGTVQFREYTDEIIKSFSRVDDGVYIEEANYQYSENPFGDGMSIDNLDTYFETIKKDHDALMKEMAENPDRDYDIAGFWSYQDGVRFRAAINYIH